MWYFIIATIVAFATFTVMYAYYKSLDTHLTYIDVWETAGFGFPIIAGCLWPVTTLIGGIYLIFKLFLGKYYNKFAK